MNDIKPCPFCGCQNISIVAGSTFRWRAAQCNNCGAQCGEVRIETSGPGADEWDSKARELAIAEWNKRVVM